MLYKDIPKSWIVVCTSNNLESLKPGFHQRRKLKLKQHTQTHKRIQQRGGRGDDGEAEGMTGEGVEGART